MKKTTMKEDETQILESLGNIELNQKLQYLFKRCVKAEYHNHVSTLIFLKMFVQEFFQNYFCRSIEKIRSIFSKRIKYNSLIDEELVR